MWDLAATTIFILFGAILSLDSFLKWRLTRQVLYFITAVLAAITAMAFIFSWESGFCATLPTLLARLIAGLVASRSSGSKTEEKSPD